MKIKIINIFWDSGDPMRNKNIIFNSKQSLKLKNYLKSFYDIDYNLYDFSNYKLLDESYVKHIPKPELKYHKSWKINRIIEDSKDYDIFISLDSDVFLSENDYPQVKNYIDDVLNNNVFYVSNLNDLISTTGIKFHNDTIDYDNLKFVDRYVNSLGPFYIVKICDLYKVGGFNEGFTVWGGEDDEMALVLEKNNLFKKTMKIKPFHIPHNRNHMINIVNNEEYKKQCELFNNIENRKKFI